MKGLLLVGAAVVAVAATFTLHSAEKESAAFALYTGVCDASGTACDFLSRYRTSAETAAIVNFSSEMPQALMLIIR